MAGTLPGIPLSQQFSAVGRPLPGCLLYFYAANTTTPQDSFLDQGLTIKNPWPLAADNSGRVPMFYLADGSIHVRLTDNGGVVQFDYPSMMVVGPSSGTGGGGGTSVDPTTIFQTGDCIWLEQSSPRTGWVFDNGTTIGNASSSASQRAAADCQALFVYLWTNKTNTECPVSGGRGASGLADFNNNKNIQLPDKRGYAPCGSTSMGTADLGNLAGVPFTGTGQFGNSSTTGSKGGEAVHTLLPGELAAHKHPAYIYDVGHKHTITDPSTGLNAGVGTGRGSSGNMVDTLSGSAALVVSNVGTGVRVRDAASNLDTTDANSGGGSHNTTPLIVIGSYYRKL